MKVTSRIMKICMITMLVFTILAGSSRIYAATELNLGLTLWRKNDADNYYKSHHYVGGEVSNGLENEDNLVGYMTETAADGLKYVWKIVQQDGTTLDYSKSIYCLKQGVGFTNITNITTTTDSVTYDKQLDMLNSADQATILKILDIDEATYHKILWILNKSYDPNTSTAEDRAKLLTDSGVQAMIDDYKDSLDAWGQSTSEIEAFGMLDDDIDVVQQMAIWCYTNGNSTTLADLKTAYTNSYSEIMSSVTGRTFTDQYNYRDVIFGIPVGEWRQELCEKLFEYLVTNADSSFDLSTLTKKATFWTNETDYSNADALKSGTATYSVQPVVVIEKGNFDLALRKFITTISDGSYKDTYYREPSITAEQIQKLANGDVTTVEKTHDKTPIEVNTGDIVTYTIRIYNEGDLSGYATEVTDYLPDGLKFIPATESSINKAYNWKCYDGKTVTTDYLKTHKLNAFDGTTIDYVDLEIECEVIEENSSAQKTLKNVAEITAAKDENGNTVDRDSVPNNLTDSQKQNYNPGTSERGWGYEDDDDYEDLVLPGKKVDFSLRKFITAIGDTEITDRIPQVDTTNLNQTVGGTYVTTATYNHPKTPLTVKVGDVVTYTIRVYNEGEINGYISKITDHLPEYLDFLPDDEDNNNYLWEYDLSDSSLRTITTKITASDVSNGLIGTDDVYSDRSNGKLLLAWDGTPNTLDYIDVKVKCKVNSLAQQGTYMTNIAEISGMTDEAGTVLTTDRDSQPSNVLLPTDEALPNYKQTEINRGDSYIPGQQDDDDFEKIIIQVFDLRLRKFITAVDDTAVTDRYPVVSYKTDPTVNSNILEYTHPKKESPVSVVKGNVVIYTLRVYNEGDVAGFAEEITDYLIDNGLKFLPDNDINKTYGWKMIDASGNETTDVTKAVKVVTDYLSFRRGLPIGTGTNANLLYPFDRTAELSNTNPHYLDIQIAFEVIESNESQRILENAAEISKNVDMDGNVITDIDSTPDRTHGNDIYENNGNGANDEDDFDKDYVRLTSFDLALRKFITDVSGMPVNNRYPDPVYSDTLNRIVYNHPKTPVEVAYGDVVTYTIRIYNEGTQDGYAQEITDDIPDYLTFLPENQTNIDYRWILRDKDGNVVTDIKDAVYITTDYLSKEQGEARGEDTLLKAFNKDTGISDNNPDYLDVKIAMRVDLQVTGDNLEEAKRILINEAQISEDADKDGNPVTDIDSVPHRDDKYNYDGDNEDDIDYEPVKVKYFDLALKKWVTQSIVTENGKTTVTESGHTGDENPEPAMKVEIKSKSINKVNVKFRFKIKVTNEGEIAGYAKEVTDHIPDGLEFVQADNPDWYTKEGNLVATRALENTLLEPGESATVEIVLQWINGNSNFGLKTNYAEISEDYNASNTPDIDSTPGNLNGEPVEDDEDQAPVVLSIKTGEAPMYFALTGSVIGMFTGGVFAIKKYVI